MPMFASNWKRLLAFLVDIILLNTIITRPLAKLAESQMPENILDILSLDFKNLLIITSIISIINVTYWVALEYKIRQTVGGLLFHLQMKSEAKTSLFQIILRNITKISLVLLIIDSIGILFSSKKQRFTERMSKTATIENG